MHRKIKKKLILKLSIFFITKMLTVELKKEDYIYYDNFGLWIHKDVPVEAITEAQSEEIYCVSKRWADKGKDYWGYLTNKGEEVKVIWV